MKTKYYPTLDEVTFILEEKLNSNIRMDTMYSIPFMYPCDKDCHFQLDIMAVLTPKDQNFSSRLENLMLIEWTKEKVEELHTLHLKYKGRTIE